MGIRAFFFDIGGVLVSSNVESYLDRGAELFGVTPDEIQKHSSPLARELERGSISGLDFWRQLGDSLGKETEDADCQKLWHDSMMDSLEVYLPMLRVCQALARQGYVVGALSNAIADHATLLRRRGIYTPFSPLVLSCEVGCRKPEKMIYRKAAQAAGVPPQQCLLIDDSAHNLPAARECGFLTYHFRGVEPLVNYLRRWRYLAAHQPAPPLAAATVQVSNDPEETTSEEPPLPAPPCNLEQDPWLTGEEQFPWGQDLEEQLRFCLNFATLAPSLWNSQPWTFRVEGTRVRMEPNWGRWLSELDPDQEQLRISFGVAFQFLELALRFFGFEVKLLQRGLTTELEVSGRPAAKTLDQSSDRLVQRFRHLPYVRSDPRPFSQPDSELWQLFQQAEGPVYRSFMGPDELDLELLEKRLFEDWEKPATRKRIIECSRNRRGDGGWSGRALGSGKLSGWFQERVQGLAGSLWKGAVQRMLAKTPRFAILSLKQPDEPESWFETGRELARLLLDARVLGISSCWLPQLSGFDGKAMAVVRLGKSHNLSPHPRLALSQVLIAQDTSQDIRTEDDATLGDPDPEAHAQV